mmetsp:Transcript_12030/g.23635  ORF Transcript_12030/g.23635 Transcript_12030/m.23635 type:complete len:357 (-) Transcript_12030:154-1224(-)
MGGCTSSPPSRMDIDRKLLVAAGWGDLKVVKEMLEQGARVEIKNIHGETAMIFSARYGHREVVRYLVEHGKARVETRDNEGRMALINAAANGHLDVVKYLIENAKANVMARDWRGSTPLTYSSAHGHLDLVKYLIEEAKAKVDATNCYAVTALNSGVENGHLGVVRYLVEEAKSQVESRERRRNGETPLIQAARLGNLEMVEYLIEEAKANVEAKTEEGWTPLFLAADEGHLEVVQYLVEHAKVNVKAKDVFGWTALDRARMVPKSVFSLNVADYLSEIQEKFMVKVAKALQRDLWFLRRLHPKVLCYINGKLLPAVQDGSSMVTVSNGRNIVKGTGLCCGCRGGDRMAPGCHPAG